MKPTLDYPPVWLIAALLVAWGQAQAVPLGGPGLAYWPGTVIAGAGLALMALAVPSFLAARTTIIPHRDPSALMTGGIYRYSRNPIYLGDALFLAGMCLRWGAWPSLVLVPLLGWVLTRRFIEPEEARLRAAFGAQAEAFMQRTRRWV